MAYEVSRTGRTIWWPVMISVPVDGGTPEKIEWEMKLQLPLKSEARAADKSVDPDAYDKYMLARVKDWKSCPHFIDPKTRQPIEFSEEALDVLLDNGWFETGLVRALSQANAGMAAVKN